MNDSTTDKLWRLVGLACVFASSACVGMALIWALEHLL
jgi:hypothetical protein